MKPSTGRQIVLDTETTGLSAEGGDRIIEIGCVELVARKLTGNNKHFYLNPGRDSHEDALKVHGISNEFLRDKPKFEAVADDLLDYLSGAEIIIHNAAFDVGFLNKELELSGRPPFKQFVGSVTDTLAMAKEMFPGKRNSLDALCDRLEVDNSGRTLHGALLDAELLAGAAMSMCGLVMQQLTQNRFVEPTTTGTTEWAGLGLLLVMIAAPEAPLMARMIGAIVAAFVGTMIFFAFLRRVTLRSSVIVPIVGIMLGAIVGAVSTFVGLATNTLQSLGIWFMGSFTTVLKGQYEPLYVVTVVVVLVFLAADRFTVAGLGEDIATNVGLNYRQVVFAGTLLVAVATGVVTVVVGNLPFLGLIVPNVVSLIIGDNLRTKLPWTCLLGVALVTVCDILARVLIMPFEIPVATILSMVGAVVFIALLLRQRRHA